MTPIRSKPALEADRIVTAPVELFLPGLVGVPGRFLETLSETPEARILRNFMRRARAEPIAPGRHAPIADWLGQSTAPLAALQALAGGLGEDSQYLLATPTHFQAGMDDLVMLPPGLLSIDPAEKKALAASLHEYFAGLAPAGGQWLLESGTLDIRSCPLHEAIGRSVRANLPVGADAVHVNGWMNEMQMALHASPVNEERMSRGEPPVNGVWLWGEGSLPDSVPAGLRSMAVAGRAGRLDLAAGLARWLGVECSANLPGDGSVLVIDMTVTDALDAEQFQDWQTARDELLQRWLSPALERLQAGTAGEIVLYPGDGYRYRLARGDRRKFWRAWRTAPAIVLPEPQEFEGHH